VTAIGGLLLAKSVQLAPGSEYTVPALMIICGAPFKIMVGVIFSVIEPEEKSLIWLPAKSLKALAEELILKVGLSLDCRAVDKYKVIILLA